MASSSSASLNNSTNGTNMLGLFSGSSLLALAAIELANQYETLEALEKDLADKHHPTDVMQILKTALVPQLKGLHLQLLGHVVKGEQAEAEAFLIANRKWLSLLLSMKGTVVDYSNRTMENATVLQAALRSQDVEMWNMILPYFDKLANGQQAKAAQFNEEFPTDGMAIEQEAFDFSTIVDVIGRSTEDEIKAALDKKQNDSLICQTLNQFRKDFTARSLAEKHFNPQHLQKALWLYEIHFNTFRTLDQRDLFWRQVIGYVQRYLPSCYAQALSQDFWGIVKNKQPLKRSFEFQHDKTHVIYPLSSPDSFSGLGFDYVGVGPYCLSGGVVEGWVWVRCLSDFKDYVEQKQVALKTLSSNCNNLPTKSI